ncbi:hypothetical protein [Variovorax sp. Root411]|uniref:hypothetical protein n=1 Tax=Variovorax sp. Root411 TaxID=1736530 RepID=UPI000AD0DBF1|nr:hypothetical protein [Variovorax sp. Root411]
MEFFSERKDEMMDAQWRYSSDGGDLWQAVPCASYEFFWLHEPGGCCWAIA